MAAAARIRLIGIRLDLDNLEAVIRVVTCDVPAGIVNEPRAALRRLGHMA